MTNVHNLQLSIIYEIHDIKYISDGRRLEAPTIANEIEPTLLLSHKILATICPSPRGVEDQSYTYTQCQETVRFNFQTETRSGF